MVGPPKSANGEITLTLSSIHKTIGYLATAAIMATFVATINNLITLNVLAEKVSRVEGRLGFRDARVEKLETELDKVRLSVDHHVAGEGHTVTFRRLDRIERDLEDCKKD